MSGDAETDGVQTGCANEYQVMVFPGPLPIGEYDVIIDEGCSETPGKVGFSVR